MLPKPRITPYLELSQELKFNNPANPLHFPVTNPFLQSLFGFKLDPENFSLHLPPTKQPIQPCKFQCYACEGVFNTLQGLNQHIGKVHRTREKKLKCSQCDHMFKHKYALNYHIKQVHQRATRVECPYCEASLYNKYILDDHIRKHHPDS